MYRVNSFCATRVQSPKLTPPSSPPNNISFFRWCTCTVCPEAYAIWAAVGAHPGGGGCELSKTGEYA